MPLTTYDFNSLVRQQATTIQSAAKALVDVTVGSITRALIEANASLLLWLQGLLLGILVKTRAATSEGADLDSWMADFGLTRLPAQKAAGVVTFSRFTQGSTVAIPAGTTVQTSDRAWQFVTTADASMAPTQTSVQVPVQAVVAGAGGNAAAGGVTMLVGSLPGVDTVSNAAAFVGGLDGESDAAFRARFVTWVNGLSKATGSAIGAAISAVRPGLTYTITENVTYAGTSQPGHFFIVVDDGTGSPSAQLLDSVRAAVDASRPLTSSFAVFAPIVVQANVAVIVTVGQGYDPASVRAAVSAALVSFLNSLALGQALPYTRLSQVIYGASPGVVNATTLTLNGGAADLNPNSRQVIKAGVITVS